MCFSFVHNNEISFSLKFMCDFKRKTGYLSCMYLNGVHEIFQSKNSLHFGFIWDQKVFFSLKCSKGHNSISNRINRMGSSWSILFLIWITNDWDHYWTRIFNNSTATRIFNNSTAEYNQKPFFCDFVVVDVWENNNNEVG